jgi:nucleoid-associated protein YgaU
MPIHGLWMARAPALAAAALLAGCMTPLEDAREEAVRQREDVLLLQEDIRRLSGRIEGLEMETARLRADLDGLQRRQDADRASTGRGLQAQVEALQQRLQQLDAARQKDREQLLDSLSRKMADILQRSVPAGNAAGRSGARSGSGYEHTVKSGETLSAIAQAYGVRMSAILEANRMSDPDQLRVGQVLFIPEAKP